MFGRKRSGGPRSAREALALIVVVSSMLIIAAVSGLAIGLAKDPAASAKDVFTTVLPVLGTWVGTVLAFYFARENLEAAARLTGGRQGVDQPVTGVMLAEADWITLDVKEGQDPKELTIKQLRDQMGKNKPPSRRLPIRDPARVVLYVIHDSTLNAYADEKKPADLDAVKLGELLDDAKFKQLVEAIGFVSQTADISEARLVMSSIDNCNDVFVTPSGKKDERAIGWLTNTQLAETQ
jgi:hypothetical protein